MRFVYKSAFIIRIDALLCRNFAFPAFDKSFLIQIMTAVHPSMISDRRHE